MIGHRKSLKYVLCSSKLALRTGVPLIGSSAFVTIADRLSSGERAWLVAVKACPVLSYPILRVLRTSSPFRLIFSKDKAAQRLMKKLRDENNGLLDDANSTEHETETKTGEGCLSARAYLSC